MIDQELTEEEEHGPREVDLSCPDCDARLTWDPDVDALSCAYCGHHQQVPRGEGTIVERPLEEMDEAPQGFGLQMRVLRCETCGARISFEGVETSTSCVFCGSASVLPQAVSRHVIRPESVIPLTLGRSELRENFERWIRGLWFRPSALGKTRDFAARGVYVPAWTFDCDVASSWSADSGTYYHVTRRVRVMVGGRATYRMRRVRKVRWRPAWGDRRDTFDDLQVSASHGIREDLMRRLGPFDTRELRPYRAEFLAGWHAEEYQIGLLEGWDRARREVEEIQRGRCASDVPGDTHRNLRVQNTIRDVRWKHVLLPVWTLSYRFRNKTYTVLLHGQLGRVVGDAPFSWIKITLFVLMLAAIVLAIVIVANG